MTTFDEKLQFAKAEAILTEEEAEATGGAYFDEELGLWMRQDGDGRAIMPFGWQMALARDGQAATIRLLFDAMGLGAAIEAYDKQVAEAEALRAADGRQD